MASNKDLQQPRDKNTDDQSKTSVNKNADLSDSPRDEEKLRSDEATIDMPEVKDIPGQENVRVPRIREMEDTTISSADEEGEGILDELNAGDDEEPVIRMGTDADTTRTDVEMLRTADSYYPSKDEEHLVEASMVNTDDDGEPLNEKGFGVSMRTAKDLDVPGEENDDTMEESGAEDEENNEYSLGGDDNDQLEERNT